MLSQPRISTSWMQPLNEEFLGYLPHSEMRPEMIPTDFSLPFIKDNTYKINLDLRHFAPEEIHVKCDRNILEVSGKHEKKSEDDSNEQ